MFANFINFFLNNTKGNNSNINDRMNKEMKLEKMTVFGNIQKINNKKFCFFKKKDPMYITPRQKKIGQEIIILCFPSDYSHIKLGFVKKSWSHSFT